MNTLKCPLFLCRLNMRSLSRFKRQINGDDIFKLVSALFAFSIPLLIAFIVYELVKESWLSIQTFGLGFIFGTKWDPAISRVFGALPLILGTIITSAIALLIGVPISLGVGLALSEYMPKKFGFAISFMVELLAAVPSVIYGLWGIFVLVPFLRDNVYSRL